MDLKLSQALGPVRMALTEAAQVSGRRRLRMFKSAKIPCQAGCSGCCSRMIKTTVAEAVLMYEHLKGQGKWPEIRKVVVEAASAMRDTSPLTWFLMDSKCPILNEKSRLCEAYAVRPVACSTHFVQSDPALCSPHSVVRGSYDPIDFDDIAEKFLRRLIANVAGYGILQVQLPLPSAMLLAEQLNLQSGITIDRAISLITSELQGSIT